MTVGSLADEAIEPFPHGGLGALLATAAAESPDAILFRDDDGVVTAAEVAERVRQTSSSLRTSGLATGDRVLIVAGAQTAAIIALAAVLTIGAEPALVPCGLGPVDLAAHARAAGAVALVGPASYGGLQLGDIYLSTAAIVDTIRLLATQGPEPLDGALDISFQALAALPAPHNMGEVNGGGAPETSVIATFQGPSAAPSLILHRQAALFADALSLVEKARINPTRRIISTLPPTTMAGLVAGPFAALVGASSLSLHGPFDARRFLAACDETPGAHLVAPCAIGQAFEDKRLAGDLTSLILVSRFADPQSFALPPPLACDRPMVDLYAFGEDTLLARRRTDGEARPPARVTDKSAGGGLGARLNRARSDTGRPTFKTATQDMP